MIKLDKEEREIVKSFENGEWRSVPNLEKEKKRFQGYARATFRKNKRVNIRVTQHDLESLQVRAVQEGIPYQTLLSSVLHKYVSGRLKEMA
jgi:predicted DNA binding CopG/RHH family protein